MAASARVGDPSDHGGVIITSGQNNTVRNEGKNIAVQGALHSCPQQGHGTTPITAITTRTRINGKLIVTTGAVAGCGAIIQGLGTNYDVE